LEPLDERTHDRALIAGSRLAGIIDRVCRGEDCRCRSVEVIRPLDEISPAGAERCTTVDLQATEFVDDAPERVCFQLCDVIDADAEELLDHGDNDRPSALVGDSAERLTGLDLSGGIEHEHGSEFTGGGNMDDSENVTLAR